MIAEIEDIAINAGGDIDSYQYGQPINGFLHTANSGQVKRFLALVNENNSKLQLLDLSECDIDDTCLAQIGQVSGLVQLTISDTNVTGQQFSMLADLPLYRLELKRLDLTDADWMGLPKSTLSTLLLDGSRISQTEVANFLKTTNVFRLGVGVTKIGDELKDAILQQAVGRLRQLELSGSDIDDHFVSRLKDFEISRLNLSRTNVTDAVFDSLIAMKFEKAGVIVQVWQPVEFRRPN